MLVGRDRNSSRLIPRRINSTNGWRMLIARSIDMVWQMHYLMLGVTVPPHTSHWQALRIPGQGSTNSRAITRSRRTGRRKVRVYLPDNKFPGSPPYAKGSLEVTFERVQRRTR